MKRHKLEETAVETTKEYILPSNSPFSSMNMTVEKKPQGSRQFKNSAELRFPCGLTLPPFTKISETLHFFSSSIDVIPKMEETAVETTKEDSLPYKAALPSINTSCAYPR